MKVSLMKQRVRRICGISQGKMSRETTYGDNSFVAEIVRLESIKDTLRKYFVFVGAAYSRYQLEKRYKWKEIETAFKKLYIDRRNCQFGTYQSSRIFGKHKRYSYRADSQRHGGAW